MGSIFGGILDIGGNMLGGLTFGMEIFGGCKLAKGGMLHWGGGGGGTMCWAC